MLSKYKIRAYATLVKAGKYILDEADRENESQVLIPSDYTIVVAEYITAQ
jgi:hypothetical protein